MGQLTLDGEQIGRGAIVGFRPNLSVAAGVDQFCVDANPITRALYRAFHDVNDAELSADFAHVALSACLVLAHAGVADNLQIRDLREIGQNLVLDAIGEIGVVLVVA